MAPTEPEAYKCLTKACSRCGSKDNCTFCYLDNGKLDQPRYKCLACKNLFAFVDHGRSHNKKYAKKRNVDPEEVRDLPRQCPHCKCADRVPFKYYNNKITTQPVFQCLHCKKRFQMRLEANATERRLVHTGRAVRGGHSKALRPPKRNTIHPHAACSPCMSEDSAEATNQSTWLKLPMDEEQFHQEMNILAQVEAGDDIDLDSFAELLEMDLTAIEEVEETQRECGRLMRERASRVTWLPDPMDSTALALRQALASF